MDKSGISEVGLKNERHEHPGSIHVLAICVAEIADVFNFLGAGRQHQKKTCDQGQSPAGIDSDGLVTGKSESNRDRIELSLIKK